MSDPTPPPPPGAPTVGLGSGQPPRGAEAGLVGSRLGDYEVLEELGRGGMGVVYKARQINANRVVALKMILSAQPDGESRARFQREAEAAAQLAHPHVVQIHEVGTWHSPEGDSLPFFSMEYCTGGSLAGYLDGTPLAPGRAAALVEVLARAVHAAHAKRLVHRDLKPANVLLAPDDRGDVGSAVLLEKEAPDAAPLIEALAQARQALARRRGGGAPPAADRKAPSGRPPARAAQRWVPKITDFGLARRTDDDTALTVTGAIVGTPSYLAPEQARGEKEVGPACDVWALGAILYECLTGRPPFLAASPFETLMQVVEKEPAPPQQLNAQVPADLQAVCLRCLEKRPHRRYGSAAELADDLRRFRDGQPTRARPRGLLGRANLWCRHPRRVRDAGRVTVFVALVLGCWVALCGACCALGVDGAGSAGVPLLVGTGGLALALLCTAAGTLRRRPFALWAGLVLSSLGLLALVGCLAGHPLVAAVAEGGAFADAPARVPFFALLSVLVGVVVAAHVVAAAAHLSDREPAARGGEAEEGAA
jgi:serine/threonine protein kinase